jgi:hypothetical protein
MKWNNVEVGWPPGAITFKLGFKKICHLLRTRFCVKEGNLSQELNTDQQFKFTWRRKQSRFPKRHVKKNLRRWTKSKKMGCVSESYTIIKAL